MYKKALAGLAGIALTIILATPAAADTWRDEQYWLDDYGFTTAWETSMGEGVTVGIIDTGIDASHQDLSGQVVGGYDASRTSGTNGTTPMGPDPNHGTMVASLPAMVTAIHQKTTRTTKTPKTTKIKTRTRTKTPLRKKNSRRSMNLAPMVSSAQRQRLNCCPCLCSSTTAHQMSHRLINKSPTG